MAAAAEIHVDRDSEDSEQYDEPPVEAADRSSKVSFLY